MVELELVKVTFTFKDDSQKVLEGEELGTWMGICYGYSDYLLPGAPDHVLASMLGGVVRGFVPPDRVSGLWSRIRVTGSGTQKGGDSYVQVETKDYP